MRFSRSLSAFQLAGLHLWPRNIHLDTWKQRALNNQIGSCTLVAGVPDVLHGCSVA